ncbi:DNA modification methylase [Raineya sp.]
MVIASRILKTEKIEWQKAQWLQKNLKELSDEKFEKLKESLKKYFFVMPFMVWQDQEGIIWILDGHHRQKVLNEMINSGINIPEYLDAVFIDCKNKKEAAELVLVYTSQYAKMTQQGLNDFLQNFNLDLLELKIAVDIPEFSFDRFEQKFDLYGVQEINPIEDEIPVSEAPVLVKKGDIFQLGKHKLIVGDSTKAETFEILMQNEKAQIVFTDPPYNLSYKDFGGHGKVQHKDFAMAAGEMSDWEFVEFLENYMKNLVKYSIDGSIHYHFMDFRHVWHVCQAASGQETYKTCIPKQICVWNKSVAANGSFYRAKHEFCLIFKNGKAKHKSHIDLADRYRTNIWDYPSANDIANPDRKEKGGIGQLANHPTPKPVQMVADVLLDASDEGDIVIDCFIGSGTTLIAAEKTSRICRGVEFDEHYAQLIILRYYNYCQKNNINFAFEHLNGSLKIEDLL